MKKLKPLHLKAVEGKFASIRENLEEYIHLENEEKHRKDFDISRNPFILSAAVLVFFDPTTLKPLSGSFTEEEKRDHIQQLIRCSELVLSSERKEFNNSAEDNVIQFDKKVQYHLNEDIRKKALALIFKEYSSFEFAIEINSEISENNVTVLQQIFNLCLTNTIPDLTTMSLQQLNALQKIILWFEGVKIMSYSPQMIERTTKLAEMTYAFRNLTGKYEDGKFIEFFGGRTKELATLRKYVGVAEPKGAIESLNRLYENFVEPIFNWDKKPPLSIFGLGGVGKSTLLAKFILDHYSEYEKERFPFVYLDFDKTTLNVLEPETLLIEACRQLSIQYSDVLPLAEQFNNFTRMWGNTISSAYSTISTEKIFLRTQAQTTSIKQKRSLMLSEFVLILTSLSSYEKRPFLLIIDTFEEIQYRGVEFVKQLYHFLLQFQNNYSSLRVVIAGRAPVTEIPTQEIELTSLDAEAALGFLYNSGITNENIGREIIFKFGRNPLTLKLAVALFNKDSDDALGVVDAPDKKTLLMEDRLSEIQVQGMLYKRILQHIHVPAVRDVAHPGLLLRELTADVILKVLSGPCKLKVYTIEGANQLFDEISKEVSLVNRVNSETLRHRSDVRKIMLELIRKDNPKLVKLIHRRAVAYYERLEGIAMQSEAFYHRLCLEHSSKVLDSKWVEGMQNYLTGNMDELPPKSQSYLSARTGIENVNLFVWDQADNKTIERRVIHQAANLLNAGEAEKAIRVIDESPVLSLQSGLLTLIKVRALVQLGQIEVGKELAESMLSSFYASNLDPLIRAELHNLLTQQPQEQEELFPNLRSEDNEAEMPENGLSNLASHDDLDADSPTLQFPL